jgi:hypothetical protein
MKEKRLYAKPEAYKDMRNKPSDEETRYNYALAKKMLKENPPKDDKRIRIRTKTKRSGQERQKDKRQR